ncbi:uncharacterized protein LOC134727747 [Mytilus trossulus]|uniref:uncharacterized protein LOC134727747 n=1 Tax=Mytilus trossulus TaxID=6551 RepID=UPI003005CD8E
MSDRGNSARGRKRTLTDSARKRNRKDAQAAYQKSKIHIGDEIDRWNDLKDLLRLENHTQVAKILLDRYAIQDRNISPRKRSNLEGNEVFKTPTHTSPSTSMKSATPDHKVTTPSKKSKYEEFKTPSNVAQSSPSMSYATPDPKALT